MRSSVPNPTSSIQTRPSPVKPTQPAGIGTKSAIAQPRSGSGANTYTPKNYTPVPKTTASSTRTEPAASPRPASDSLKAAITKPIAPSSQKTYTPSSKTVSSPTRMTPPAKPSADRNYPSSGGAVTSVRTSEIGKNLLSARKTAPVVKSETRALSTTSTELAKSFRPSQPSTTTQRATVGNSGADGHTRIDNDTSKWHLDPIKRKGGELTHSRTSDQNSNARMASSSFTDLHRQRTSQTPTGHDTIIVNNTIIAGGHGLRYEDRGYSNAGYRNRYSHVYRDSHNRLLHRIVYPKYSCEIFYNWGTSYRVHLDYPYYRRRYVFVSLGGYWPSYCNYRRYYWYPSHFYYWYGYRPIACEIPTATTNYYTYNYYGDTSGQAAAYVYDTGGYATHETYADIREKMAETEDVEPAGEELSDTYFEAGVKAFEDADYGKAVERFAEAMRLAPDDEILPFAFAQALFADGRYDQAAEVIRAVTADFEPEKKGLFYPRGLYVDEEILLKQIDQLAGQAEIAALNPDVQLLLGYHLLGIGEIEASIEQLSKAANAPENTESATALLKMAVQIKTASQIENDK